MNQQGFDFGQSVEYPDHPLLVRGPDVLGQQGSDLMALFVYGPQSQPPDSKREASRVLLSRLALPRATRFGAIWVDQPPTSLDAFGLFDEVQLADSRAQLFERETLGNDASQAVESLRRYQYDRFAEAWAGRRLGSRRDRYKRGRSTWDLRKWQVDSLPRWIDGDSEGLVANIEPSASRSQLIPKVQTLSSTASTIDFGLRQGLEGLRETAAMVEGGDAHLALHRLATKIAPSPVTRTIDPLKPFRAAAFAGVEVDYPEE